MKKKPKATKMKNKAMDKRTDSKKSAMATKGKKKKGC